jgi:hypothetical protein
MEKHNSLVASFLLFFKVSVLRLADEQPAALFLQAAHQSRKPLDFQRKTSGRSFLPQQV